MEDNESGLIMPSRILRLNDKVIKHAKRYPKTSIKRQHLFLVYDLNEQDFDMLFAQLEEIELRRKKP